MRGLIFSTYDKSFYSNLRIIEEANRLGIELELCNPYLSFLPKDTNYEFLLLRTTGVLYNDQDLQLAKSWQQTFSKPVINPPLPLFELRDRPNQYLWALKHNLSPIPTCNFDIKHLHEVTIFPSNLHSNRYVVKTWRGNQARGVTLINDNKQLFNWYEQMNSRQDFRYILQPCLDIVVEFRHLFIGETFYNVKKTSTTANDRLKLFSGPDANFKLIKQLPDEIERLANKARAASGIVYGALDFALTQDGQVYLMELNTMPGFEKMENLPGLNIAGTLVKCIQSKFL